MRTVQSIFAVVLGLVLFVPVLAQGAGLTQQDVENATYIGIDDEPVQLTDGFYEGEPFVEDGNERLRVELQPPTVYGDFDLDGVDDAAVLLVANAGGTGRFYYLAILQQGEDGPDNTATVWLGDRLQVDEFAADDQGNIVLDMITTSQFDGACCPTLRVRHTFTFLGTSLEQTFSQVLGATADDPSPISIEKIANAAYALPSDPDIEVTLVEGQYRDEEINLTATLKDAPSFGDLNGDGEFDAVVVIDASAGGSGTLRNLVVILNAGETVTQSAAVLLGEVVIEEISIVDGNILVDTITRGVGDADCCPTEPEKIAYALDGSELVEIQLHENIATMLANLAYPSSRVESGKALLVNGFYNEPDMYVSLSSHVAAGDLNGDGVADAAAILITDPDGTAAFYDLYAILGEGDISVPLASVEIGDRVEIHNLTIVDGEIVLVAAVHGPDDADCCPTQVVERRYAVQEEALAQTDEQLIEAVLYGAGRIVPGGTFDPEADGTSSFTLGGTTSQWLDPSLVSVLSGVVDGSAVDAQTLGADCVGYIPATPDLVVDWTEDADVAALNIFVLSIGDPVLVIVTPTGDIVCNDDYSPLVPDPYIEIPTPQTGRYAIFVGSFDDDAVMPGFVVVSGSGLNPVTFDSTLFFPPQLDPSAVRVPIDANAMLVDEAPQVAADAPLNVAALPFTTTLVAGGELEAFNVELDNPHCTGFISGAPAFAFVWDGTGDEVTLLFEAAADTTLLVRDPAGNYLCNDDSRGATNLNPAQSLTPTAGRYLVWVGSFAPNTATEGVLTIAVGAVTPVPLTIGQTD